LIYSNVLAQTNNDIVAAAVGSANHTILIAAVKAVFLKQCAFHCISLINAAFTGILTHHPVSAILNKKTVLSAMKKGNEMAAITTVAGGKLTASIENGKVILTDEKGGKATVTSAD
jgi:hypothetical protein